MLQTINCHQSIMNSAYIKATDSTAMSQSCEDSDPRTFKPTKRVRKSTLALLAANLKNYIYKDFLIVRKQKRSSTVKTYVYLVFREQTDLRWMKKIVHRILPLTETVKKCSNGGGCTCVACAVGEKKRVLKRRGFGYIRESDLHRLKRDLEAQGYVCSIEPLPIVNKPVVRRFVCEICDFACSTKLGYVSHSRKHRNDDSSS